jgi:predicted membrane channel-forming protein YqfA (hemolysin III family)
MFLVEMSLWELNCLDFLWEMAGGALFMLASVCGAVFFHSFSGNPASLIVIAPFLLTGLLFILHHVLYHVAKKE